MTTLTEAQARVLRGMHYTQLPEVKAHLENEFNLRIFNWLLKEGLLEHTQGSHNDAMYWMTPAGREALAEWEESR